MKSTHQSLLIRRLLHQRDKKTSSSSGFFHSSPQYGSRLPSALRQSHRHHRSVVIPLLFTLATAVSISCCEEEQKQPQESPLVTEDTDDDDDVEEEDEETDCVMCLTFRQGPCGNTWRKLERCFKRNETATAKNCSKHFVAHQECLGGYLNLYQLISLDSKQQLVRDTRLTVIDGSEKFMLDSEQHRVDWKAWKSFGKEAGSSFRQSIVDDNKDVTLWKRFPPNVEPVLVATEAKLPTTLPNATSKGGADEKEAMILKYAYAVDQDGWTIGLSYHDYYGELSSRADKNDATEEHSDGGGDEEQKTTPVLAPEFNLEFYIVPGETRTVQLYALYTDNPLTAGSSKRLLDIKLGSSPVYNLGEVQKQEPSP